MSQSTPIAHSRDNTVRFFTTYVETNSNELAGKTVVDLSAGSGYIAHLFEKAGAVVCPFDLFPDQNQFTKVKSKSIDLQKKFPIESQSADLVICAETIEHLPNQLFLFQETARILKPNGQKPILYLLKKEWIPSGLHTIVHYTEELCLWMHTLTL